MRGRHSLGQSVISTVGNEWLSWKPFFGPISLPRVIGSPVLYSAAMAGEGFLALSRALAGGHIGVGQYGKPGELLYGLHPVFQEFGEMGMMLYNILVLFSMAKELYIDLPYNCFSSMSNYALSQQLQGGKFKPLNENTTSAYKWLLPLLPVAGSSITMTPAGPIAPLSLGLPIVSALISISLLGYNRDFLSNPVERTKAMFQNTTPMFVAGGSMLIGASGGLPLFLLVNFLVSKGFNYSTYARQKSDEFAASDNLRRALNTVGQDRIPANIRAELTGTMISIVESGDHRASMQKYLIALLAAKGYEAVNDNLAIDIAREVARTGRGGVYVPNAADVALAQSATRHRDNTESYIKEAAQILMNNGVNYTRHDTADTQKFVEIVRQRQDSRARNR